ncbi:hypothetical protein QE152_g36504 [Popillia japonica]|uniref:BESS domain-containing protein n=1 Tax=Popillia japonica TaxID=7064 RepID=A0AAW1IDC6_POPJA
MSDERHSSKTNGGSDRQHRRRFGQFPGTYSDADCTHPTCIYLNAQNSQKKKEGSDSFRAPTPTPTVPIPHASTSTPKTRKRKLQKDDDDGVRAITDILRSVELQRHEKDADRMGNKAFLASILPFLDKMSDEVVMEARGGSYAYYASGASCHEKKRQK